MTAPVAFVPGGASGIGRATVLRLACDGFRVIAADRNGGKLKTLAQEAARRVIAGARIVTVSSRAAIGGTNFAHYVASKAGVIGLTRAMAMELRPREIAVNSVAPGFTDTPMTRTLPPDQYARAQELELGGRAADPADIAGAIAFPASPATHFITGQILFVDGGKSLGGLGL